ncbi:MAG: exodeoxyribonuclease VII large subunit [Oscillospiraceae bacterium]|jgi:exodeoxyribonuclease VII large subunit|nr:exodeoxyribonuclease VII large subunit [Oscillospiraceae bacterium]
MFSFNIITVSQLNVYLKSLLDGDKILGECLVKGEISNFKRHYPSGHLYFSLKDKAVSIRAVMFKSSAQNLRFSLTDGMEVIVRGNVSLYERDGGVQIYAADILPDGIGALNFAFEQLKEKLAKEGLFDPGHKKPLPKFPEAIGIVSSKTGAALQDILNILRRRWPPAKIVLAPALVQGDAAGEQIARGIAALNKTRCDVIIMGRGGGSIEELWAFNTEAVARAVYNSKIPVVSAVGHETDFTIADFVADLRAPTPSAAAELVSPDINGVLQYLDEMAGSMRENAAGRIKSIRQSLLDSPLRDNILRLHKERKSETLRLAETLSSLSPLDVLLRGYAIASGKGGVIKSVRDCAAGDQIDIRFKDGSVLAEIAGICPA